MGIKLILTATGILTTMMIYAKNDNSVNATFSNQLKTCITFGYLINQSDSIIPGSRFIIDMAHDSLYRQFPFAYKFGRKIFISYSEHEDAVVTSPIDAMVISRDNGVKWDKKMTNGDFYISSMFKKGSRLYGIVYFTYPVSPDEEKMIYWTSGDRGRTWTKHQGIVNPVKGKKFKLNGTKGIWGSMLFHRGMMVMSDGSIQGPMYGYFEGDKKYCVAWVKSDDNCSTWNVVSIIASGTPKGFSSAQGYCEPTFAKVKDGTLLCIMRIDSFLPLFQSRSKDGGLTWSNPVELPGLNQTKSQSVDPDLLLMKNGTLVLSYGRPNIRIAISSDGSGYK